MRIAIPKITRKRGRFAYGVGVIGALASGLDVIKGLWDDVCINGHIVIFIIYHWPAGRVAFRWGGAWLIVLQKTRRQ